MKLINKVSLIHSLLMSYLAMSACSEAPNKVQLEAKKNYGSGDDTNTSDASPNSPKSNKQDENKDEANKNEDDWEKSGEDEPAGEMSQAPNTGKPETQIPIEPMMPRDCKSFTWDQIKSPEDATCFKSIPEAFASLPDSVTPFWILMHKSRSAQKSSLDKPRIIITAPDGSFLLGVSTDQSSRQDLELAVFDYEKSEWQFAGIDYSTNPPTVEKELCKSCHGSSPHPIWTQYGAWTGAFAANNTLTNEESAFLKRVVSGDAGVPELLKKLKYRAANNYEAGRRLAPATKYYGGEENSQVLNYVTMQKAAQVVVGRLLKLPETKATDLLSLSAEISCGTQNGSLKRFGLSIPKDLSFALEGTDRLGDMFNGRFRASDYLAAELVGRALAKDPSLKASLPDASKAFSDARYRYFTTKNLAEHNQFMASARTSIRSLMSDYLNQTIKNAISSPNHCKAVEDLAKSAQFAP